MKTHRTALAPDIKLIFHGSIVQFYPVTKAGLQFLQDDVCSEGWQWMGRSLCVDHHMAPGLAEAAIEHGLELRR
jgi:hypothetical protein